MSTTMVIVTILASAAVTIFLRALPFIAFRGNRKMPVALEKLGAVLPGAIMAILIVYCLKDVDSNWIGVGIPRFIGVLVVAATYIWKHSTLLSIVSGTACYMLLLNIM